MRVLRIAALSLMLAAQVAICSTGCASATVIRGTAGKPWGTLQSSPRLGFVPLRVVFLLELHGDDEALWCPAVGWSFGDGSRSFQGGDCDPWTPGEKAQRFYSMEHVYKRRSEGEGYLVVAAAAREGRTVARADTRVEVR